MHLKMSTAKWQPFYSCLASMWIQYCNFSFTVTQLGRTVTVWQPVIHPMKCGLPPPHRLQLPEIAGITPRTIILHPPRPTPIDPSHGHEGKMSVMSLLAESWVQKETTFMTLQNLHCMLEHQSPRRTPRGRIRVHDIQLICLQRNHLLIHMDHHRPGHRHLGPLILMVCNVQ